MMSLDEVKATLMEGSEAAVEPSLLFVLESTDVALLESLALFALETAVEKPHAMAYGPRMMIAGAAMARARELEPSPAERPTDRQLLTDLNTLQQEIQSERLTAPDGLRRFGPLGAQLSRGSHHPFLDLEVDSAEDDSVLLWSSGAAALEALRRP